MDKTTFALESFKNIQDLIKFVDQKSAAVMVFTGLIFTGYLQFLTKLRLENCSNITISGILVFLTSSMTFFSLIFVIYNTLFNVLKARIAMYYNGEDLSLLYYEHIYIAGKEKILQQYNSLEEGNILINIIEQQFEVSSILHQKAIALRKSLKWLFISIISLLIFILILNLN